jgi:hypothetical protein
MSKAYFLPKQGTVLNQIQACPSGAGPVGCGDTIMPFIAAQAVDRPRVSGLIRGGAEHHLSTGLQ